MNRRDIIIIAVLINAGLLAILFMTAIHTDDDKISDESHLNQVVGSIQIADKNSKAPQQFNDETTNDDMDDQTNDPFEIALVDDKTESDTDDHSTETVSRENEKKINDSDEKYVTVTVKKGDFLEKIARSNGTSVSAIKKANRLSNERIEIGQVLKIPLNTSNKIAETKAIAQTIKNADKVISSAEAQYYTVKSGDNPWKIAKQFNVKFDDLVKLNNLDEEKARNLKVGDKIRVK